MYKNKTAVVTGAGGTLCSAIAIDLAKKGANVVLVGRTKGKLDAVYEKIQTFGGVALVYPCDVTDVSSVKALATEAEKRFGGCDYLINGAGGNNIKAMPTITKYDPSFPKGKRAFTI